ncbi:uncharacterized protein LOC131669668 [Phymastichus coffea]|uniref:uncharacterized protein LOC131669668 n=1 Tax=Phymastichus coffea TaxID=108790 RepID=UPI00273B8C56|nr:uncharacterized protein LOC131669668 [Phymastichus coffea]
MIVILVPFFLAAQLREAAWHGGGGGGGGSVPEATYRFSLNSTAVSASRLQARAADRSTRFDMSALLKCRFRGPASLLCHMTDSKAVSFASSTLDPALPGVPLPGTTDQHPEYQLAEEAFEVTFTPYGIGKILVNRSVSPADLNMIRAVVNQLNVGANIAQRKEAQFQHTEKSLIGKCDTTYRVAKDSSGGAAAESAPQPWEDDYRLSGLESLGRRKAETLRLEKRRNLHKCSLRADYFFGSREGLKTDPSDFEARVVSSESTIYVSDEQFASYTHNELEIDRRYGEDLIVYENYAMSLMSVDLAEVGLIPASIVDPVSASIYAYQYVDDDDDDDESAEMHERARVASSSSSSPSRSSRR